MQRIVLIEVDARFVLQRVQKRSFTGGIVARMLSQDCD